MDPFAALETESAAPCGDPHVLLGFERVFNRLFERERQLLGLRLDGFSYEEMGEQLTMKEGAVAVAMQRLRERLHVLLSSEVLDLGSPEASSGGRRSPRKQE
ncbi:MAG: sigma factor-like helix-turn-helix DNA-binding protein [Candidatus Eisenbacteria bacterium]